MKEDGFGRKSLEVLATRRRYQDNRMGTDGRVRWSEIVREDEGQEDPRGANVLAQAQNSDMSEAEAGTMGRSDARNSGTDIRGGQAQ